MSVFGDFAIDIIKLVYKSSLLLLENPPNLALCAPIANRKGFSFRFFVAVPSIECRSYMQTCECQKQNCECVRVGIASCMEVLLVEWLAISRNIDILL